MGTKSFLPRRSCSLTAANFPSLTPIIPCSQWVWEGRPPPGRSGCSRPLTTGGKAQHLIVTPWAPPKILFEPVIPPGFRTIHCQKVGLKGGLTGPRVQMVLKEDAVSVAELCRKIAPGRAVCVLEGRKFANFSGRAGEHGKSLELPGGVD